MQQLQQQQVQQQQYGSSWQREKDTERGGGAVKPTRVVLHLAYLTHLMKNQQDISIYDGAVPVL